MGPGVDKLAGDKNLVLLTVLPDLAAKPALGSGVTLHATPLARALLGALSDRRKDGKLEALVPVAAAYVARELSNLLLDPLNGRWNGPLHGVELGLEQVDPSFEVVGGILPVLQPLTQVIALVYRRVALGLHLVALGRHLGVGIGEPYANLPDLVDVHALLKRRVGFLDLVGIGLGGGHLSLYHLEVGGGEWKVESVL